MIHRTKIVLALLLFVVPGIAAAEEAVKPIRALLVTGGCCHDYGEQKKILSEGISERANVTWKIVHHADQTREGQVDLFLDPDWHNGYDIVLHNECYGGVTDLGYIHRITKPHYDGVAAIVVHCALHTFRNAETDEWRKLLGVTSFSHEKHRAVEVKNLATAHPIMQAFPETWKTPQGELYKIEKAWDHMTPLGQAFGEDTKKNHVCVWTNQYGKGRVFGTSLGHHNVTMRSPEYLDMMARGLLWSCKKLDDEGQPLAGYGPSE